VRLLSVITKLAVPEAPERTYELGCLVSRETHILLFLLLLLVGAVISRSLYSKIIFQVLIGLRLNPGYNSKPLVGVTPFVLMIMVQVVFYLERLVLEESLVNVFLFPEIAW
jgi:hypothetical protein